MHMQLSIISVKTRLCKVFFSLYGKKEYLIATLSYWHTIVKLRERERKRERDILSIIRMYSTMIQFFANSFIACVRVRSKHMTFFICTS